MKLQYTNQSAKFYNIKNFKSDGFEKVCDVKENYSNWFYTNINNDLMFSNHRSWVYAITLNNVIVKLGETSNPLGIKMSDGQPKQTSKCRLGRYRTGDGTDAYIRKSLNEYIRNGDTVSIWAKKCPIKILTENIAGSNIKVSNTIHKSLEQAYFSYFFANTWCLPLLNKSKK